jgi:amino acid adenylation domain-containing protein
MSRQFPLEEIEQSIAQRFEKQAAAHPDRIAISSGGLAMTYADLNAAANRLGRTILHAGPEAERVVLLFEQGIPVVVAVLAILKAGKTYVPLDPAYPHARLVELLEDAQAGLILTNSRHLTRAEELASEASLAVVNADAIDPASSGDNLDVRVAPDAIAYMLYTSGSTGRPKGVVQKHRNLLHFVRTYTNSLGITPQDRIGWLHSITFSASNMNVYPALLNGAAVYPHDVKERGVDGLAELLMRERITICQCVPTVFRHFLSGLTGEERFPDLRVFELGGEPVYRRDVELFRRRVGSHCVLVNRLAFTEASVAAQYFISAETELPGSAVPVGRPADGMEILVLGEDGREAGPEEVGEITLRSRHLSPGYWRRPDLTTKAFPSSSNGNGIRTYRTGDLGRLRADGLLEYAGRKDFRVKVRGYTIEVAEVEAALLEIGGVKSAVVMAREDQRGDQRLVAYLVPAGTPPIIAELRTRLGERLPDFMVPSAFMVLDTFPLTSTGKLDRLALPAPDPAQVEASNGYAAPRTTVEGKVAAIWAEVFGLDRVGIHDDFFALGGHSLLAGQIAARLRRVYSVDLSLGALFDAPTVAELCVQLGEVGVGKLDA